MAVYEGLVFHLISHGLKKWGVEEDGKIVGYGVPKADLYIDCRGIREHDLPDHDRGGTATTFQAAVEAESAETIHAILRLIAFSLPQIRSRRIEDKNPYNRPYVVCFMCAHGVHRSVATKHIIARKLKGVGHEVVVK